MRRLRIGLAQIDTTVGALDDNAARVAQAIERARALGVDVLAVPEMTIPGYPPEDLLLRASFVDRAQEVTRALAPLTRGLTAIVGTVERDGDVYNAAAVLHDGAWAGTYRKRYLPNYGVFDENRYFMTGRECPVFVRDGTVIGVSICEDIWYPGGPVEEQVIRGGAELLVNISASPYHAGKAEDRRRMLATRAADNVAVVCYVNLVGGQDELAFDGASLVVDEGGRTLAEGALFAEDFLVVDVDFGEIFTRRLHDPRLRKERALAEGGPLRRIELAPVAGPPAKPVLEPRPAAPDRGAVAELYDALVFGTREYARKNGFRDLVVGLSGGVDSALVACIAADAVGPQHVVGVSMPSEFTSGASRADAEALARALGLRFHTLPIRDVFDAFARTLAAPFSGRDADVTEENLQARIRGSLLMALSNKFGWLVLVTGNKSEIAVGYNTLYGDTAGGWAVLKDVYKTDVYRLAAWRNGLGGAPIPAYTLERAPSAELRPGQTDQDSLPPYDALDAMLRLIVEEDRSIEDVVALGHDAATVERIVRMIRAAEWKRYQMPPGVKVSPRAFGRDWRWPVTNAWKR